MAIRYEYWRHVLTGDIYAVKLDDARVIGACLMDRHEAHEEVFGPLVLLDVAGVRVDRRSKANTVLDGSLGNDAASRRSTAKVSVPDERGCPSPDRSQGSPRRKAPESAA